MALLKSSQVAEPTTCASVRLAGVPSDELPPWTARQMWVCPPPSVDSKFCSGAPASPWSEPMKLLVNRLTRPPDVSRGSVEKSQ